MTESPFESVSLFDILIGELTKLFQPLRDVVDDPRSLDRLLAEIGANASTAGGDALVEALSAVIEIETKLQALASDDSPSFDEIAAALEASDKAFRALRALDSSGGPAAALEGLSRDLVDLLLAAYLNGRHPLVRAVAILLTLIEPAEEQQFRLPVVDGDTVKRLPFALDRFHLDRISKLLRDPAETLRAEYIQNDLLTVADANATADKLFPRLVRVLRLLDVPCRYGIDPGDEPLLGDPEQLLHHALIIYAADELADAEAEAGVVLILSSADRGDLGIVASPFGELTFTGHMGDWKTELALTAEVQTIAYGRHGVTLLASPSTTQVLGRFSATLTPPEEGPAFVFGSPTGTRLEIGGAQIKAEMALSEANQTLDLAALVSLSQIVIAPGDADSFLASFLPPEGLQAKFDLGLEWSNEHGITFRGATGLDATIPVGLSIGNVLLAPTIHLGLQGKDSVLNCEVSVSLALSVGPILAVADRIGLKTVVTFPEDGGNLGVADLDIGFKTPSGVGVAIDATVVSGGGFLSFDSDKGQYAGVLQLNIGDRLTLTAIGLIATRLPDGSKGFSFVVIITAEGFQPIPLGLGFTLTRIGGLLAINRTCNEEVLREGIKNQTLSNILSPKDPIRNAPEIISSLNAVFPARSGSYLFGPIVQICWGTPPVLTFDLGLVLEFGNRTRLIILGRISAILPSEKQDLIRLQMNTVGVIDFDQKSASVDAVLYDSRLLSKFPLTGAMAMRLSWGASPSFALSIGGFHPAFKPPSNFPALERIAISLSDSADFRLRCEAYLAITANTLQFGAHAELYARAGGFSVEGRIGYDVLIQFDPFLFMADFAASVQLKQGSENLFKVKVEGQLSGPRPLHVKGKATFEIFRCDFSVGFDRNLISGVPPPPPAPVVVMEKLKAALNDPRNWGGQLAEGERPMVSLRGGQDPNEIALHPLGRLSVKQTVVPLELEIARFGQTTPAGARLFKINTVSVNGKAVGFDPAQDFFSPASFLEMTDEEKLAAPSFVLMNAGVSLDVGGFLFTTSDADLIEDQTIRYETVKVDTEDTQPPPPQTTVLNPAFLDQQLRFGAAGRSEVRRTGRAKYRHAGVKNTLVKDGWMIVSRLDQSKQAAPGVEAGVAVTYAEAFQALQTVKRENPSRGKGLMILRASEVVSLS